MSAIIEMILENPIIIIVIIGIFSSLFSKKKQAQPVPRHERVPPKQTVRRREPIGRETVSPPLRTETNSEPAAIFAETNEMIQQAELAEARKKAQEHKNPIKLEAVEHRDLTKKKYQLDPKSDQVLQGLIWAEVLAAPKAKRKRNI